VSDSERAAVSLPLHMTVFQSVHQLMAERGDPAESSEFDLRCVLTLDKLSAPASSSPSTGDDLNSEANATTSQQAPSFPTSAMPPPPLVALPRTSLATEDSLGALSPPSIFSMPPPPSLGAIPLVRQISATSRALALLSDGSSGAGGGLSTDDYLLLQGVSGGSDNGRFAQAVELLCRLRFLLLEEAATSQVGSSSNATDSGDTSGDDDDDDGGGGEGNNNATASSVAAAAAALARADLWQNPALALKLQQQMTPLAVVTGAVPAWVRWLPRLAPFLWSLAARVKSLRAMAFGVSRGIVVMQEDMHPTASLRTEYEGLLQREDWDRAMRVDQRINDAVNAHASSQVAKNTLAKASSQGTALLREASEAFSDLEFLKSGSMEVIFKNESGFGSGVTAGFYNRVAAQLQTRGVALGLAPVGASPPADSPSSLQTEDADLSRVALSVCADHPLLSMQAGLQPSSADSTLSLVQALLATHTLVVSSGTAAMTSTGFAATASAFEARGSSSLEHSPDAEADSKVVLVPLSAPAWKAVGGQFVLQCAGLDNADGSTTATTTPETTPPAATRATQTLGTEDIPRTLGEIAPAAAAPPPPLASPPPPPPPASPASPPATPPMAPPVLPMIRQTVATAVPRAEASPAPAGEAVEGEASLTRAKEEEEGLDDADLVFAAEYPLPAVLVPKPFHGSFVVLRVHTSSESASKRQRIPKATLLFMQEEEEGGVARLDGKDDGKDDSSEGKNAEKGSRDKRSRDESDSSTTTSASTANTGNGTGTTGGEGEVEGAVTGAALLLLRLPFALGGRTLDLWPQGNSQQRTSKAVKVTVLAARRRQPLAQTQTVAPTFRFGGGGDIPNRGSGGGGQRSGGRVMIEVDVEGALPEEWLPSKRKHSDGKVGDGDAGNDDDDDDEDGSNEDGEDGSGVSMSSLVGGAGGVDVDFTELAPLGEVLSGCFWNAPLWAPDATTAAFVPSSSVSQASPPPSKEGLFPSSVTSSTLLPSTKHRPEVSVEAAAALSASVHGVINPRTGLFPAPLPPGADGTLVVRRFRFLGRLLGKALVDTHLVPLPLHPALFALLRGDRLDPCTYFASAGSHMSSGSKGSHVAQLFAVLPELDRIHAAAAAASSSALGSGGGSDACLAELLEPLLEKAQPFTSGLPLGEWLEYGDLPWADPITGAVLPPPPDHTPDHTATLPRISFGVQPTQTVSSSSSSSSSLQVPWSATASVLPCPSWRHITFS